MVEDLRPDLDACFDAFGVPATVTRPVPDDTPIATTVIWVPEFTEDAPVGSGFARREVRRIAALRRDQVATAPIDTVIAAPLLLGGTVRNWRVDATDRVDSEHHRVVVVEVI